MSDSVGGGESGGGAGQDSEADNEPPQQPPPLLPGGAGEISEEGASPSAKRLRMSEEGVGQDQVVEPGQRNEETPTQPSSLQGMPAQTAEGTGLCLF